MNAKVMEVKMTQWLPIFEAQAQSGMGKEKWCEANGIRSWDFFKWQRKIREYLLAHNSTGPGSVAPCLPSETEFVDITPVLLSSSAVVSGKPGTVVNAYDHVDDPLSSINIEYGGFTVGVSGGIDKKLLSTVLEVIRDVN